ncbi:saccharopine dehydrogenase family protein [Agaribacter marinus]|uniref:Saccharopine dehydrogenase n=1 Tax=Agaribacter marinus TaxID=1431249 RepID=A0AA37WHE3_9ALTE|nr:saccharopine dehydrogenase NADP-binding domain-containing protein [Agaribacter marinus]GLR71011.1 saccharopine dehydrogenase [Agaribacter marinus]
MRKVLILGGYGNFGKRIVENLAKIENIIIYVAGRNRDKATACINQLKANSAANLVPLTIDIFASDFEERLKTLSPYLVIHTSGPFQGQDYRVPKACIEANAHYIDLADDRRFVCDIAKLNTHAKEKEVLVVSGASSVPGLSSAVVEHYQAQFKSLTSIDLAIAPGNKAERGLATVEAILSYTGHPLHAFKDGRWQDVFGWMDSNVNDFGGIVGKRHLANVDVPDLELFPERYSVTERVTFQAGLELSILHKTMVGMATLAKKGFVKNWAPMAKSIVTASKLFLPFGTDNGAMEVLLKGIDQNDNEKSIKWRLYAPNGNGPYIPTLSTIILAKKLLETNTTDAGAKPCVGLFKLSDFAPYFDVLDIHSETQL